MNFNRASSRLTSTGAFWHCPRRTANRPGSQHMARHKSTDFLQSAPAGRHAADGDRPRSGGSIEMRPPPSRAPTGASDTRAQDGRARNSFRPAAYHYRAGRTEVRAPTLTGCLVKFTVSGVIRFLLLSLCLSALADAMAEPTLPPDQFQSDDEFLELLERKAFDYFWLEANPANGLIRDRSRTNSYCSIASVGFGLTAIGVGIDHGWITREQGRERVLRTLRTFHERPQGPDAVGHIGYRGWFYHFLDMDTGLRAWKCELSSIDTALFLAGALYTREYFSGAHADEVAIRDLVNRIYNRTDWHWMTSGSNAGATRGPTPDPSQEGNSKPDARQPLPVSGSAGVGTLSMGWRPESGFIKSRWIGYNEATILLLLGLGANDSPDTEAQRAVGILPAGERKDLPTGRRQHVGTARSQ